MNIELDVNLVQAVLQYLQTRPWLEVNNIVVPLLQAADAHNKAQAALQAAVIKDGAGE